MTDGDKLRTLARYLDDYELDEDAPWTYKSELQADLRKIAARLDECYEARWSRRVP